MDGGSNFSLVVQTSLILFSFVVGMLSNLIQSKIIEKLEEFELQHISRRNLLKYFIIHPGGRRWGRRVLGPRNDVFTTSKAVTLCGGHQIIAVFFPK